MGLLFPYHIPANNIFSGLILSLYGSSLMDRNMGHMLTLEDLNRGTPSVYHINDTLFGSSRKPFFCENDLYSSPSSISSMLFCIRLHRRLLCCRSWWNVFLWNNCCNWCKRGISTKYDVLLSTIKLVLQFGQLSISSAKEKSQCPHNLWIIKGEFNFEKYFLNLYNEEWIISVVKQWTAINDNRSDRHAPVILCFNANDKINKALCAIVTDDPWYIGLSEWQAGPSSSSPSVAKSSSFPSSSSLSVSRNAFSSQSNHKSSSSSSRDRFCSSIKVSSFFELMEPSWLHL